jgi:hypothetical protein
MLKLDGLHAADFVPLLHESFRIEAGKHSLGLELVEVNEGERKRLTETRAPFSLLFKGAPDQLMPQHMYRIEHETLGAMDLFIVPVRADRSGCYYEAIFT